MIDRILIVLVSLLDSLEGPRAETADASTSSRFAPSADDVIIASRSTGRPGKVAVALRSTPSFVPEPSQHRQRANG